MDVTGALDKLRSDLGTDLRVFVAVHPERVDVEYVRRDIESAPEGTTFADTRESHLRDIANVMLRPGGTASIRYTGDAIVVGLPTPDADGTGYLISLEHTASESVDEFIDTLLDEGATILQSTTTGPEFFTDNGNSAQLND